MRNLMIAGALALSLSGCASGWPAGSYVEMSAPTDAPVLASSIAGYVTMEVPAGGKVALANSPRSAAKGGAGRVLASAVRSELSRDGLVVVPSGGAVVSYVVMPLGDGLLLRVLVGAGGSSRYFVRDDAGLLEPGGPLMVATQ